MIHYDTLLQNAAAILLQNVTEVYCKICQFLYYKTRQLLQNATILSKNATAITKYDVYYKLRQYKLACWKILIGERKSSDNRMTLHENKHVQSKIIFLLWLFLLWSMWGSVHKYNINCFVHLTSKYWPCLISQE